MQSYLKRVSSISNGHLCTDFGFVFSVAVTAKNVLANIEDINTIVNIIFFTFAPPFNCFLFAPLSPSHDILFHLEKHKVYINNSHTLRQFL